MPFERQYCRFMMNETDPRDEVCTTCGCIENPQGCMVVDSLVARQFSSHVSAGYGYLSQRARSDIRVGEISLVVSCRLVVILEALVDAVRQIINGLPAPAPAAARTAPAATRCAPAAQSELMI